MGIGYVTPTGWQKIEKTNHNQIKEGKPPFDEKICLLGTSETICSARWSISDKKWDFLGLVKRLPDRELYWRNLPTKEETHESNWLSPLNTLMFRYNKIPVGKKLLVRYSSPFEVSLDLWLEADFPSGEYHWQKPEHLASGNSQVFEGFLIDEVPKSMITANLTGFVDPLWSFSRY